MPTRVLIILALVAALVILAAGAVVRAGPRLDLTVSLQIDPPRADEKR